MDNKPATMMIDEVKYVRADSVQATPAGPRAVVVLDKGWIFAGDVDEADGRIVLSNAVQVRRWDSIGFEGMIADPDNSKVTIKKMPNSVDIPACAELFRIPVGEGWGL